MKKIGFVAGVFMLLLASFIINVGGAESNVDSKVMKALSENETADVIIMIKDSGKRTLRAAAASSNNQVQEIIGDKIENRLGEINAVSAKLTREEIEELSRIGGVEIYQDGVVYAQLQDSVPLVNASLTQTKQVSGINLTGEGQTICIIDTGVDYTHSDLGGCFGNNNASSGCKVVGGYNYVDDNENPMDDNGHGTHVSGIAAANGSVKGVAPGARIVMIKALDSGGSGSFSDVASAISWCIGNASTYNISVISMSLGVRCTTTPAGCFSNYCDGLVGGDVIAPFVNSAVAKNISVLVASGNDNNYTAISYPSCLRNVTAIGSTNKSDSLSGFGNRAPILRIVAPGSSINSTYLGGGYFVDDGTSMSTPHVAAAIAIFNQFMRLTGQTQKTPRQIETIFNNTGKIVSLNYSRINLFGALLTVNLRPNVSLISPSNGSSFFNINQTFRCNASDLSIKNGTFYLWNTTSLVNSSTSNFSGSYAFIERNISLTALMNYTWTCGFTNENNNVTLASNFTLLYDSFPPSINLYSPINGSIYGYGVFNVSLNENGTCIYTLNSGIVNVSMNSSDNRNFFSINNTLTAGNYSVRYYCNDSIGNFNSTISSFNITNSTPSISLISPGDGYSVSSNLASIDFSFNVSNIYNITGCGLVINNAIVAGNSSFVNVSSNNTITYEISPGSYTWGINCTNSVGNTANSSFNGITVSSIEVGSSGGGGGSGGSGGGAAVSSPSKYDISEEQLSRGYTRGITTNDSIYFVVKNGNKSDKYDLVLESLTNLSARFSLINHSLRFGLLIGESVRFNLSSSDSYDLYIKLNNISSKRAELTVLKINETIVHEEVNVSVPSSNSVANGREYEWKFYILVGIAMLVIILAVYKIRHSGTKHKKH